MNPPLNQWFLSIYILIFLTPSDIRRNSILHNTLFDLQQLTGTTLYKSGTYNLNLMGLLSYCWNLCPHTHNT